MIRWSQLSYSKNCGVCLCHVKGDIWKLVLFLQGRSCLQIWQQKHTPDFRLPTSWKPLLSPHAPVCTTQGRTVHSGTHNGWHWGSVPWSLPGSEAESYNPKAPLSWTPVYYDPPTVGIPPFSLPKWPYTWSGWAPALPILVATGRSRVRWIPVLTKEAFLQPPA